MAFALLLFLAVALGFLFASAAPFSPPLSPSLFTLALIGLITGLVLFLVAFGAAVQPLTGRPLPADADPDDVRVARRVLRTGQLSGRFQVDRIARVIAAQALRREVRPWMAALFGTLIGGNSLLNAFTQYQSHDGWHWKVVFLLVAGACCLVGTAVLIPWEGRVIRRIRAFAEAYDARRRKRPPEEPARP